MSSTFNILNFTSDILEKIIYKPCINKECQVIFNKNIPTVFNDFFYNNCYTTKYLMYNIIHYVGLIPKESTKNLLFNKSLQIIKEENLQQIIIDNILKYYNLYSTPFYFTTFKNHYRFRSITKSYCPKSCRNILKEIILYLENNMNLMFNFTKFYDIGDFSIEYYYYIICRFIINMNDDIKEKLKNDTYKHHIGKFNRDFIYTNYKPNCRYKSLLGDYYDEINNNQNNIFMIEVCDKFIYSTYNILHNYDDELDTDEIINILDNQRKMKSIIYKE